MNSIRWIVLMLLGTLFTAGCGLEYHQKRTIQASGTDLNQVQGMIDNKVLDGKVGGNGGWLFLRTAYNLSGVRYSSVDPLFSPEVSAVTTALVVQAGGLKALEFGSGGSRSSTTNDRNYSNLPSPDAQNWSTVFADPKVHFDAVDVIFHNYVEPTLDTIKDTGSDAILGWGRWAGNTYTREGYIRYGCCSENKSAHYVFGAATPNANLPTYGTATFNLIGATSPTLSNGASAPGTLTSGVVNVAWGAVGPNPAIGVNLAGTINGNPFTVTSNLGGIASPSSGITYNAATQSFKSPAAMIDGSSVSGFFAGPNATHIGLSYSKPVTGGTVQGAAAFKR